MDARNSLVSNLLTGLLATCAVIVTAAVVRREFGAPAPPAREMLQPIKNGAQYAVHGHILGATRPRVMIVEFSDFQCPFCKRLHANVRQLLERYPTQVAVLYRHFPLSAHEYAMAAAIGSECAAAQGAFDRYADVAFAHQDSLGSIGWDVLGRLAGVRDTALFRRCTDSATPKSNVAIDVEAGKKLGVKGTPVMVLGDKAIVGYVPFDSLDAWVSASLNRLQRQ